MKLLCTLLLSFSTILGLSQAGPGSSLKFNGSSSYVDCGAINLNYTQVTMQGWVKVQSFKSAFPYISSFIGTEQSGSQCAIRFGDATLAANKVQFVLRIGGSFYKLDGLSTLSTNKWYHIAATYDGSTMKVYINGVLDNSMSASGTIQSNDDFEIGRNYGNDRIINGEIEEVSIFDTALSQAQIRDWMCQKINSSHPTYSSLTAYWPLNEGAGGSTADVSGNAYNGTLISSPQWKTSGAPIGDESVNIYSTSAISLGMAHPSGDSLAIATTSGTFDGLHIYRVDSVPNDTNAPAGVQYLDTTRYWGVFPVGNPTYTGTYYYNGNPTAASLSCNLSFARRANNAATSWISQTPDSSNYTNQFMTFSQSGQQEIIMAISNGGPHTFNFSFDEPSCYGLTDGQAFVNVSGGQSPYSYSWSTASSADSSGNVGAGTYYLLVTDANSCTSTDSVEVTQPDSIIASGNINPTTCKDTNTGSIQLNVQGGTTPYQYNWSNGSTNQNANQLYAQNYEVTITDDNGCTASKTFSVGSTGPEPFPFLGNDTTLCEGIVLGLTAETIGGPYTSYEWSTGNTGQIQVVSTAGSYSLTVENTVGCTGSDTINITYVAAVEVDLGPNNQSGINTVTLDAGSGFNNYVWNTGANTQTITVNQSGTYWVKTTDTNGCKDADTVSVTLAPQGIAGVANQSFKVYPNPAKDFVQIQTLNGVQIKSITAFDLIGRQVFESTNAQTIDVSTWKASTYFITVETIEGKKEHLRFLKL